MRIHLDPLDVLFSRLIKLLAGGLCEYCGRPPKSKQGYHCHHGVVKRRYLNTRYLTDNCAAVCKSCHDYLDDFPDENVAFFIKRIGTERYEQLKIIARTYRKMDKSRREEIRKDLENKIACLKDAE